MPGVLGDLFDAVGSARPMCKAEGTGVTGPIKLGYCTAHWQRHRRGRAGDARYANSSTQTKRDAKQMQCRGMRTAPGTRMDTVWLMADVSEMAELQPLRFRLEEGGWTDLLRCHASIARLHNLAGLGRAGGSGSTRRPR